MHMHREIEEIPEAVARLAGPGAQEEIGTVAAGLRALDPPALLTVARGSSDHAASYLKYAVERCLGLPVASLGPSTVTVHGARFRARGLAALAISQSGASRDLAALCQALGAAGAEVTLLTNSMGSPLAETAHHVIDIRAGKEQAVAATKSFVNSVVAGLWLLAHWAKDQALADALHALPGVLRDRMSAPVPEAFLDGLDRRGQAVVIGRGTGLGVAQELALKLIETCGIHATAFSGAEVLHGPRAILTEGFPVLALATGAQDGLTQATDSLRAQGADLRVLPPGAGTGHPLVDPLTDVPVLYAALEAMARRLGRSTDRPPHLSKETRTL
ncbi:SIS domain-containing protein [Ovoidimarina sediminis]|uniref:SIS domain-containing protein n=1 Tax=Ovoidimarina sediminis TaxID=3079856 RepID=UPI00290C576D|nr:SIS domain-containing protein [Rhodophyticola sp. MJ-SS7]MDU8946224.1 SIS domain-containing protein [Rhodophyticola sp. MJ-SS7]